MTATGLEFAAAGAVRREWRLAEVEALFELPFMDLLFRAQQVHRAFHAPNRVQMSTLLSIKTGGCPEDCAYCPQSIHYDTGVARDDMLPVEAVLDAARKAQAAGATRFCMGGGVPLAQEEGHRAHRRDDPRSRRAGPRDLRHAGHADAGTGA